MLSAERSELVHDPVGIEEGPVVDDAEQSRSRNLPQAIDPRAPPYNAKVDKSADGIDGGVAKPLTGKQELSRALSSIVDPMRERSSLRTGFV